MEALNRVLSTPTPQTEPLDERQTVNNAGGYSYKAGIWGRLRRFLVLGTEGGNYYQTERALTIDNMGVVDACIKADGPVLVDTVTSISRAGFAAKNTPAIYALAVASVKGDDETKAMAHDSIVEVCRTGTHLFEYIDFVSKLGGGWGKGKKRGINGYLSSKPIDLLTWHAVKYGQRHGWTWRDVLRMTHPKTGDPVRNAVYGWMVGKPWPDGVEMPKKVAGYEQMARAENAIQAESVAVIYDLPWEAVPGEFRTESFWLSRYMSLPYGALLRQISTFARKGMLKPLSGTDVRVAERLADPKGLVHPMQILEALIVHQSGGRAGRSRGGTFTTSQPVMAALLEAFPKTFQNVEPANKRFYIGLDVSGSMTQSVGGSSVLNCQVASAAQALITARTEPYTYIAGFSDRMKPMTVNKTTTLEQFVAQGGAMGFGATDCSLPMLDAIEKDLDVDVFVIYTDSETYAGRMHPMEALHKYRAAKGIEARLVVVGMASNGFTIADPEDPLCLDIVGFDTSTPKTISAFAAGRF